MSPITILGASLIAWWTADRADLISLNGSAVTSWKDVKVGYDALQGVSAARPVYSATSFNGAPGVTFDGVDDELTCTAAGLLAALPDGSEPSNIFAIVSQDAVASDATVRHVGGYGNSSSSDRRVLTRVQVAGPLNRMQAQFGDGAANRVCPPPSADFSSRHLMQGRFQADGGTALLDQLSGGKVSFVPATVPTRLRIGAATASVASSFFSGKFRDFFITDGSETAEQLVSLHSWAVPRRML